MNQNFAVTLKPKYVWKTGCKIYLRWWKGFCLFFMVDRLGPEITSRIIFIC